MPPSLASQPPWPRPRRKRPVTSWSASWARHICQVRRIWPPSGHQGPLSAVCGRGARHHAVFSAPTTALTLTFRDTSSPTRFPWWHALCCDTLSVHRRQPAPRRGLRSARNGAQRTLRLFGGAAPTLSRIISSLLSDRSLSAGCAVSRRATAVPACPERLSPSRRRPRLSAGTKASPRSASGFRGASTR